MKAQLALNHPCIRNASVFTEICKPLASLGITFFGYTALDASGNAYCMGSKPEYAIEYLLRNHVKNDIHVMPNKEVRGFEYDFWDYVSLDNSQEELYRMAAAFDQGHTLSLTKYDKKMTHCFHFSGKMNDVGINERYLSKMDSIHAFVDFFQTALTSIDEVKEIYDYPTVINNRDKLNNKKSVMVLNTSPKTLSFPLQTDNTLRFKQMERYCLKASERVCLYWLKMGKSESMIADILGVSRKTVERQVASIKEKFNCYTLFQLGEKVKELGVSDILDLGSRINH